MKFIITLAFIFLLGFPSVSEGASSMFPLGIRMNNPGNIELRPETDWLGKTRLQDHKRFIRFIRPEYGIRAIMKILITYQDTHKLVNIKEIIYRWAPPVENDSNSYVSFVSNMLEVKPHTVIDVYDINTIIALSKAIILQENGYPPADMPKYWYEEVAYHEAALMVLGE